MNRRTLITRLESLLKDFELSNLENLGIGIERRKLEQYSDYIFELKRKGDERDFKHYLKSLIEVRYPPEEPNYENMGASL